MAHTIDEHARTAKLFCLIAVCKSIMGFHDMLDSLTQRDPKKSISQTTNIEPIAIAGAVGSYASFPMHSLPMVKSVAFTWTTLQTYLENVSKESCSRWQNLYTESSDCLVILGNQIITVSTHAKLMIIPVPKYFKTKKVFPNQTLRDLFSPRITGKKTPRPDATSKTKTLAMCKLML